MDIYLRPASVFVNGMTVDAFNVFTPYNATTITICARGLSDGTVWIKSYEWFIGSDAIADTVTAGPSLVFPLARISALAPGLADVPASVRIMNDSNLYSNPQTFTIHIRSVIPVVSASVAVAPDAVGRDTITVQRNQPAYFSGTAVDPFGGIDTLQWIFGDGSPDWVSADSNAQVGHLYDTAGTFSAIFRAKDVEGNTVSDTVVVTVTVPLVAAPVYLSPADGDTASSATDTIVLSWNAVAGTGITYNVYLDWQNTVPAIKVASAISETMLKVAVEDGKTYYWAVETVSGDGNARGGVWRVTANTGLDFDPPVITVQPANETVTAGQTATFSILATGDALQYQWQKNGVDITGANATAYTTPATSISDSGTIYRCVVWNAGDTVTSNVAVLGVNLTGLVVPIIFTQPLNRQVTEGWCESFSIYADGTDLQYQWQKNGVDISGADTAEYTTPPAALSDNGATYRCVVWNSADTLTSNVAVLTVEAAITPYPCMRFIPAYDSSFLMGQTGIAESVHQVIFTQNFYMDTTEVTQGQYSALMTAAYAGYTNPGWSYGSGANYPAYNVNWYDAALYCNARTKNAGSNDTVYIYDSITGTPGNKCAMYGLNIHFNSGGYRLPTEAEWEYACRAGTTTEYFWGADVAVAGTFSWHSGNSSSTAHPVAQKMANRFGLYDMAGNEWEWCNDWYGAYGSGTEVDPVGPVGGSDRVLRGGSWNGSNDHLSSASRYNGIYSLPDSRSYDFGFRVVLPAQ
jgi:formylglycine-generating enzyme required for sulfatase activity